MARASSSSFHAGFTLSVTLGSSAGSWGSGLAAGLLFDACLCCQGRAESGKGTFQRVVRVDLPSG
jgi:hypothetical protein